MLEFEKFLLYLNENVSPAIGLLLLLSTTRTIVTTMTVIHPGFLYYTIDAHSFIVILLLVQWATVSIAPLVSVRSLNIQRTTGKVTRICFLTTGCVRYCCKSKRALYRNADTCSSLRISRCSSSKIGFVHDFHCMPQRNG